MNIDRIENSLKNIITTENLIKHNVQVEGNSDKGDGYLGDIIFLNLVGQDENGVTKTFDLVLKCSKQSENLRRQAPVSQVFKNEINVYKNIFPNLQSFQCEKNVDPFKSFAKYYDSFIDDKTEILVLDNLKKKGYSLWDRKKPLPLEHITLILKEYGKLHSISIAMQKQQPKRFEQLAKSFVYLWDQIDENLISTIQNCIRESYNLIKNEVNINISEAWRKYIDTVKNVLWNSKKEIGNCVSAIVHGDCWNNNFLFSYSDSNALVPEKVALLDWQISEVNSPIVDISYFLFACLSKEDAENIDAILDIYYNSFSINLQALGCNPELLWSKQNFLKDWKEFGKVGLRFIPLIVKAAFYNKDEIPDIEEGVENGNGFMSGFDEPIKDQDSFKERIKFIAEFAYNNQII